ncbi:hypothetical protein Barb7_01389 [Bacteroidales bacterium Barb7]|nr:hypothetical protein Barb7_01389 [Bacteroidales bacterium Barb7]
MEVVHLLMNSRLRAVKVVFYNNEDAIRRASTKQTTVHMEVAFHYHVGREYFRVLREYRMKQG